MAKLQSPCNVCGGDGISWRSGLEGATCDTCKGTGLVDGPDIPIIDDMDDKLDSIIAEQASQRVDLTAALSQIWNKVKDL